MNPVRCFAIFVILFAAGADAQDASLRLNVQGDVRIRSTGEYVSARDGQMVLPGQQLLIESDSSASVTYPDDCRIQYLLPGQYPIPPVCDPSQSRDGSQAQEQAAEAGTSPTVPAAVVGGTIAAAAGLLEATAADDDDSDGLPASP